MIWGKTEQQKCAESIKYFANTYVRVRGVYDIEPKAITLNDFQQQVVDLYATEDCFYKAGCRQIGKTVIAAIIILHHALYTEGANSVVYASKYVHSSEVVRLINEMYEQLPEHLIPSPIVQRNPHQLKFANGNTISSVGSSVDAIRGRAITLAYVQDPDYIHDLAKIMDRLIPAAAAYKARMFALDYPKQAEYFSSRREMLV